MMQNSVGDNNLQPEALTAISPLSQYRSALFTRPHPLAKNASGFQPMSDYNPFAAPDSFGDISAQTAPTRQYGGIRRLPYFGYGFLLNIGVQVIQSIAIAADARGVVLLTIPISLIGAMALAYQRCLNIGMNPWWCLGLIVPILNIFVGLRCIAYPEGYEDHKTLDTAAKVILGIFVAVIVLVILLVVLAATMSGL